jgi:hypothetical protein
MMDTLVRVKRLAIARNVPFTQKADGEMAYTVENCRTEDGVTVRRLRHLKCGACGARIFDDAMHRIQSERAKRSLAHAH